MTSLYLNLYNQLRDEILKGVYPFGSRLPSKRQLCDDFKISVITVEHAMELLIEEGYIEPRERSGYYVSYKEGDSYAVAEPVIVKEDYEPLSQTDIASCFPYGIFAKTIRRVLSERGESIFTKSPNNGTLDLRTAISAYLARNRNLFVSPEQIIIGSGAEYLYGLVVQILGRNLTYGIEKPSYEKIEQVYEANDVKRCHLALGHDGIKSSELNETKADVLHITPYRSYPTGITANAAKRREYIRWSEGRAGRYIVEDDFESEFTPSKKPQETVFSLADNGNVIYINTFSKTIAPSTRIGYMVLPKELLPVYEKRAGFYSCTVPTFDQYVLAEFINSGNFERHINRVRRRHL
ncbi:MAG: PLP-dependent aminotransferase family protein [Eubacteriales bacterium]|nr:PLP-dependent aminotransferase family protein [Eubacteriales bacterium]